MELYVTTNINGTLIYHDHPVDGCHRVRKNDLMNHFHCDSAGLDYIINSKTSLARFLNGDYAKDAHKQHHLYSILYHDFGNKENLDNAFIPMRYGGK